MYFNNLDLSKLTDEEVLFFIRIRGKKSYFNMVYTQPILDKFIGLSKYRCISEYTKDADVHIDINLVERDYLSESEFELFKEIIDINDLILRCRGLRGTTYEDAKKLVYRTFLFFLDFYSSSKKLKLIVTGAIDNYVMDIMNRVGLYYGVQFLGVTDSFMSPKYKLITTRGESTVFSTPSDTDVKDMLKNISQTALSPIAPKKNKAIKSTVYDIGSYIYRYIVRYLYKHKVLGRLEYEYKFAPLLYKCKSFGQIFAVRHLKSKKQFTPQEGVKYAYIPLHYYPEATVDYWIDNTFHVEYLSSVLDTIDKLQEKGFEVVVKEHPAYYLGRTSEFYKEIKTKTDLLLSPFISTKEIFKHIEIVVVWNGSTGIEAIVNRKPVVKVTNSYYGDNLIQSLDEIDEANVPNEKIGLEVVKKVLESSFRTF
ncbi:MAG: hypothetical protein RPS47_03210 [Colwellia sp.]